MRLLVIEDEVPLLRALKRGFEKRGYAVDTAEDGMTGSELAFVNEYDVILLDLNLPGKDGLEILQEIRERSKTQKVMILSARASVPDKILGLDMGCNDYLGKPFDFLELDARIRNLVRREFIQKDTILRLHQLEIDTAKKCVMAQGQSLELAPKEYAILEYLVLHSGRAVSPEELIQHIWDETADPFSVAVKVHISNLRKKLSAVLERDLITTVRGSGYLIEKGDRP